MKYDPQKHYQRSIRLKGYDYTQAGAYFITICTWQKECLLGEIIDERMHLNRYEEIVQYNWYDLIRRYFIFNWMLLLLCQITYMGLFGY